MRLTSCCLPLGWPQMQGPQGIWHGVEARSEGCERSGRQKSRKGCRSAGEQTQHPPLRASPITTPNPFMSAPNKSPPPPTWHFICQNETTNNAQVRTRLDGVEYIFIDEVSMVACDDNYKISSQLAKSVNKFGLPYGGINMIFAGVFAQMPPVFGVPLYSGTFCTQLMSRMMVQGQQAAIGKVLWHQVTTVVILRENMRQRHKLQKMLNCVLLLKIWNMQLVLLKILNSWKLELQEDVQSNQSCQKGNSEMFPSLLLWMLRKIELMNLGVHNMLLRQVKFWHIFFNWQIW